MTEVQQATTLENLMLDPGSYGTTGIVHDGDAVILGRASDGWIEVCRGQTISSFAPGTAVTSLADLPRQVEALRSALRAATGRHAATLAGIRSYAIDRHLDGSICHDGLNEFLRTFELEEYECE